MAEVVLGLDLSLRATGIVAVPVRWGLDWSRIAVAKAGAPLPKEASEHERARRLADSRDIITAFARKHDCSMAVVEQYAFTARDSQAHALGELGGVVKVALCELGLGVHVVSPASARRLLGKAPRKDVKIWTHQQLYAAGAPKAWTADQLDAFLIANYHLSGIGGDALMLAEAA